MARDSVRPFVVGLLFVYLLDPPVRWLVRRGVRRTLAILIVYVVGIIAFIEFLALTLTPLVNEIVRFISDFPRLAADLDAQLQRLGEFYQRLQIPAAIRDWIDGILAGIGQGGSGGGGLDLTFLLPAPDRGGSLLGLVFGYLILPVWVAYLLKDKVALTSTFDQSLPSTWRFDTWAIIKTVEHDFGKWVRGQLILGVAVGIFTFIGLLILSALIDPIFGRYAGAAVDHRWRPRAGADHRPDRLGGARGPAGGDGRACVRSSRHCCCTRSSSRSRTTSSCRRSRETRSSFTRLP
jgi:predicted PurR-regulated permease PerM